jgi:hypothetical protein
MLMRAEDQWLISLVLYVGTMCVIRVRVGVMEYCCLSSGRPTDDERCSVDVYHGCDTIAD